MAFFSRSTQPAPSPLAETPASETGLAPNVLIGLRNIEKSYAHGTSRSYVLRRITADIKEGEFVSIMGPSGAGKSTLLHIVGMHDSAWTGEYYFLDQPVHKLAAKDRAKLHKQYIGFVFQSYHLLDHLTVYENLDIPLSYRDIKKSERESMVCDILDKFAINQAKAERAQSRLQLQALKAHVQEYPGCQAFDVFARAEPDGMLVHCYTTWDTVEQLEAFLARGYTFVRMLGDVAELDSEETIVMEKVF